MFTTQRHTTPGHTEEGETPPPLVVGRLVVGGSRMLNEIRWFVSWSVANLREWRSFSPSAMWSDVKEFGGRTTLRDWYNHKP